MKHSIVHVSLVSIIAGLFSHEVATCISATVKSRETKLVFFFACAHSIPVSRVLIELSKNVELCSGTCPLKQAICVD